MPSVLPAKMRITGFCLYWHLKPRNKSVVQQAIIILRMMTFILHYVQNGSSARPAACTMDAGDVPLGIKREEPEADRLPPCSTKVKNGGAMSPFSHTSSWHGA
jgi:hypothetical protein